MLNFSTLSAGCHWVGGLRNKVMRVDSVVGVREKWSRERKSWGVGVPKGWKVREIGKNYVKMLNILQSKKG